jgi:hypothetical protein
MREVGSAKYEIRGKGSSCAAEAAQDFVAAQRTKPPDNEQKETGTPKH